MNGLLIYVNYSLLEIYIINRHAELFMFFILKQKSWLFHELWVKLRFIERGSLVILNLKILLDVLLIITQLKFVIFALMYEIYWEIKFVEVN